LFFRCVSLFCSRVRCQPNASLFPYTTLFRSKVAQYLVLMTEPKDGMPFDYNQARVFTWNVRKHRYETAYRERKLNGVLPVTVSRSEEHTSELQSHLNLVCRLLLENKNITRPP